jgi:hypothetical protein
VNGCAVPLRIGTVVHDQRDPRARGDGPVGLRPAYKVANWHRLHGSSGAPMTGIQFPGSRASRLRKYHFCEMGLAVRKWMTFKARP